ncbi:F-box domain-containing protein [Heracleum sosnowskyi]|uniref:F-box domain-containing protein n=1 Tax=Heracleum sosnowskyi TaxID=360622 RepID=A0AAD8MFS4_9APIA|nr:F-box domain-containing protein [Heracleum sosnowskyi]
MDEISVDLIHEIFIRIPIKSLLKARCVSKSWRKIIDDPFFANMQYDCGEVEEKTLLVRTLGPENTSSLYATVTAYDNEETMLIHAATVPMVKLPLQDRKIYGSCNGLLYFAEHNGGRIVVSNPLRSQFTILPSMPTRMYYCWDSHWTAIGLGFDSSTKTFKMVCTNKKPKSSHFTLVHTLGTMFWREVPSVGAYFCSKNLDYKSVYVHGFLHWMMDPFEIDNGGGRILAFDVSKETFNVVPHPELSFEKHSPRHFRILDIKGNLGMLDLSFHTKFDLWVMDYEKKSWGKEYTIDITIVGEIYVDVTEVIGLWKQDEIMFKFQNRALNPNFVHYWSYGMRTVQGRVSLSRFSSQLLVDTEDSIAGKVIDFCNADVAVDQYQMLICSF